VNADNTHGRKLRAVVRLLVPSNSGETRLWFWLVVHQTQPELVRAASRMGRPTDADTAGLFHPAWWHPKLNNDEDYEPDRPACGPANNYVGMIRLCRDHLTTMIVTHEAVHAALAAYRLTIMQDVQLGDDCLEHEEALAHLVGDLAGQVFSVLQVARETVKVG